MSNEPSFADLQENVDAFVKRMRAANSDEKVITILSSVVASLVAFCLVAKPDQAKQLMDKLIGKKE